MWQYPDPSQSSPGDELQYSSLLLGNQGFTDATGFDPQGLYQHHSAAQPYHFLTEHSAIMPGLHQASSPSKIPDPVFAAAELKKRLLQSKKHGSISRETSSTPLGEGVGVAPAPTFTPARKRFVPHPMPQPPPRDLPAESDDIEALIKAHSKPVPQPKVATNTASTPQAKTGTSAGTPAWENANITTPRAPRGPNIPGIPANPLNNSLPLASVSSLPPAEEKEIESDNSRDYSMLGNYKVTKDKVSRSPISTTQTQHQWTASTTALPLHGTSKDYAGPENTDQRTDNASKPTPLGNGAAVNISAELLKLLHNDTDDLHEWLTHTGYFDVHARKKKLERVRKMAQFEAEERKIKAQEEQIKADQERLAAERRKLMEEDCDEGFLSSRTLQTPHPPTAPRALIDAAHSGMVAEPQMRSTTGAPEKLLLAGAEPAMQMKRAEEGSEAQIQQREVNTQRLDNQVSSSNYYKPANEDGDRGRPKEKENDVEMRDADDAPSRRSSYKQRDAGHSGRSLARRSASPPTYRGYRHDSPEENDSGGFGNYDSFRNSGGGRRGVRNRSPSPRHGQRRYPNPKRVDLGGRGETRFFMVKSFNEENVRSCMEDGVWTTQLQNAEVFSNAFAHCKNVILFFSINKSKAFQGYARMASTPSSDIRAPQWMNNIHWETTPPFRVEWLNTVEINFRLVGHLRNGLNDNEPVLVGKDGQEIEEDCGHALLREMEAIIRQMNGDRSNHDDHHGGAPEPRAFRGRGGYRGGRGGKHGYIKREHDDSRWP